MLVDETIDLRQRLGSMLKWLQALDPALNAPTTKRSIPEAESRPCPRARTSVPVTLEVRTEP